MEKQNFILPEGMSSIVVNQQQLGKGGIVRGIEDADTARAILAHDPRIRSFVEGGPDDPDSLPQVDDKRVKFMARVALLARAELFATARALKISAPANMTNERLREVLVAHAAAADPESLPLLVGTSAEGGPDGGGIVMLTEAEMADPNRGNASLGERAGAPGTGSTGSTFSQSSMGGAPAPEVPQPAPSGLGMVTPGGTQQPPYNQLETLTGQPTGNQEAAPFPISVQPIDPLTGKPYLKGDPRIPETALLPERQPREIGPGSVQAVNDAASRINDAAGVDPNAPSGEKKLGDDPTARRPQSEQPPLDPLAETEAERAARLSSAARAGNPGADPNRGNDAEGKKDPDAPLKN